VLGMQAQVKTGRWGD